MAEILIDLAAAVVGGYLLGSVPFAVLAAKAFGFSDPRNAGSGNPGATNVARLGGRPAALLTLLGDFGKGAAAVWLAARLGGEPHAAAAGAAAVCGHAFSPFLKFRGGKGVATALGAFCMWHPGAGTAAAMMWALMFSLWRFSSLASLSAMAAAAAALWFIADSAWTAAAGAFVAALVFTRHRGNIGRLRRGEEKRFGKPPAAGVRRLLLALAAAVGFTIVLASVHDYPRTRAQLSMLSRGETTSHAALFYFLNEAGSGLKYFLTGNERHLTHFPSRSHQIAQLENLANSGVWQAQAKLGLLYHRGPPEERDADLALRWLRRALENAPAPRRPGIQEKITEIEQYEESDA